MQITIYRYNPEQHDKPTQQVYNIDIKAVQGAMLLDALEYIKEYLDPTLSFRRSCGEGVCGSDGMCINGKNGLACITPLHDLPEKVTLRPLPGLPVIRDLIVDMSQFFAQLEKAKPYLQNNLPIPDTERLQTPAEREKLDGLYECILCGCCSTGCPSYWWNPDKFLGPAALLASYRFIADNRDTATTERLENLKDAYSVFRCRGIMNCTTVCPKGLNPAAAIGKIKHKLLEKS